MDSMVDFTGYTSFIMAVLYQKAGPGLLSRGDGHRLSCLCLQKGRALPQVSLSTSTQIEAIGGLLGTTQMWVEHGIVFLHFPAGPWSVHAWEEAQAKATLQSKISMELREGSGHTA